MQIRNAVDNKQTRHRANRHSASSKPKLAADALPRAMLRIARGYVNSPSSRTSLPCGITWIVAEGTPHRDNGIRMQLEGMNPNVQVFKWIVAEGTPHGNNGIGMRLKGMNPNVQAFEWLVAKGGKFQ